MATSFFLWPSSAQHKGEDDGVAVETNPSPPEAAAAAASKPKVRKGATRGKAAGPKRPPQRGLGIFQLEQLRIQERNNKYPELDPSALDIPPLHFQQLAPVASGPAVYGAPVTYSVGHHLDCHLHRFRPMVPGPMAFAGAAAGSAVRSVLGDQYALDSYQRAAATAAVGDGRFRVGNPFPEPPSSQITHCISDQCEFCARKKRLFGSNLTPNVSHGADYLEMDLAAAMAVNLDSGCYTTKPKLTMAVEREVIKEFEFFPPSSVSASNSGGSSELVDRTSGDTLSASSSSMSAGFSSAPLDLSLKLSLT
ncbi:hypothetical protein Cni_G00589 [Canna indica]|uniref:Uncharacterized protein n=1 Tax=Canna indica TaxID=4628 RepID=A0AAQ3PXE9_9LILI|nr:hypothetical protein Cni_G00589 [Canna indica]